MKKTGRGGLASGADRGFPCQVSENGEGIRVLAELPGVNEEMIRIDLEGKILIISTDGRENRYRKALSLPWEAKLGRKQFRDGILELRFGKIR